MSTLEIVTFPDPFLKQETKPITEIDESIQELINNMSETMYSAPGVGLAGPQIGSDKSIIIYDTDFENGKKNLQVLINPEIISCEGKTISEKEGCLSVPDLRSNVKRYKAVQVKALDRNGKPLLIERDDFVSVILQHEIDHLHGVLFIDHLSALKREMYKRKIKKKKRKAK
ncbi:peptide deformylase [Candidatus Magnetomoraceae bacterium gMMP-15]